MSVSTYIAGDKFVLRIMKALTTNPDNVWANSYEFVATTPGSEAEILTLLNAWVEFERSLHTNAVNMVQATVSTWEADSVPYNPEAFISVPLTGLGTHTIVNQLVALSQCFSVTRVCATGRFGHLFYRGVLQEGDIEAPAGKSIFTSGSAMSLLLNTAIEDASVGDYMGSPATAAFQLSMISKDGSQVRNVVGLVAQGVSQVPSDHAWFNRTVTP
jgi:hypothetical protein